MTTILVDEINDVVALLRFGFGEIAAARLVFADEDTGSEEVDAARAASDVVDELFKVGIGAAMDAEDFKELVPEGLGVCVFLAGIRPLMREADGVLADFVPGEGHGFG